MREELKRNIWVNRIVIISCVIFFVIVFAFPSVINMRPQIQTKLLITALGIDKTQSGEVELSGIAVMPVGGTDTASVHSITVEHKAPSIGENLQGLSEIYGRQVELGLCGLIVVGESMKDENLLEHFEFLISSGFVSPGTYVTYAPNAKAKEVLSLASKLNPSSAEILASVVDYNANSNNISTVTLLQFVSQSNSISSASVIPQIVFDESKDENSQQGGENSQQGGESGQSESEGAKSAQSSEKGKESMKTAIKSLNKTALFYKGKRVGEFNDDQTLSYVLSKSGENQGTFVLDDFVVGKENLGKVQCFVYGKKFKKKCKFENGVPTIYYYPEITLQLYDQHRIIRKWKEMGMDEELITTPLLEQFANKVKNDMLSAIDYSKNSGADVFLIEDDFYRLHHAEYLKYKKDHPDFLSGVVVNIQPVIKFK